MFVRTIFAAASVVLLCSNATASDLDPAPIGNGEILIQYDGGKMPTEEQIRICHKLGGEIARTIYGGYVCVRRDT